MNESQTITLRLPKPIVDWIEETIKAGRFSTTRTAIITQLLYEAMDKDMSASKPTERVG